MERQHRHDVLVRAVAALGILSLLFVGVEDMTEPEEAVRPAALDPADQPEDGLGIPTVTATHNATRAPEQGATVEVLALPLP